MTVLIDPPLWPAHGRRWSHLVSDSSLEELHAFARSVGLPARSFEGDHYDVPEERYTEILQAGALAVGAGELARRLRDSGLRFRKRRGERPLARVAQGLAALTSEPHTLDVVASQLEQRDAGAAVVLVRRAGQIALVRNASRPGWAPPGGKVDPGETVLDAAVRELREETGLVVDPQVLRPVGYERIVFRPGATTRPFPSGTSTIQVFGVELPKTSGCGLRAALSPELGPQLGDVLEAGWFPYDGARSACGDPAWWPLVEHWWSSFTGAGEERPS